ncbi:TPA: hypothetical protein N0F65_006001 [Lagenidium giganteum]|uniref:BRCA2 OB1 domain-containing protein n=1 Tax=Lagenidium giganteum TaxID=4803 RepID=A0AAV2Z4I1_9STRA|nr:TPA: hypothetical protein N0F65_006001 [Lagenidium giganteum]
MELAFPDWLGGRYLTRDQVLYQLTKRFEKDLHQSKRSILKKIYNRDASAGSCFVIRIAAVLPFPPEEEIDAEIVPSAWWKLALVLTDGWYFIYGVPDERLATALWKMHTRVSIVGMKIVTWNAVLQNSTEGVDPLEVHVSKEQWKNPLRSKENVTSSPYLQLHYNSTRRVTFDTKLGLEKLHRRAPSKHFRDTDIDFSMLKSIPLQHVDVGGGLIRSVRILIDRKSPAMHLQPKDFVIGPRILCEDHMDTYYQVRSEVARGLMGKKDDCVQDPYMCESDLLDVSYPVPFIRLHVVCAHDTDGSNGMHRGYGILTVWRPSEDMLGALKEGFEYFVTSLSVSWKTDSNHGCGSFLRLSTTKASSFEQVEAADRRTLLLKTVDYRHRSRITVEEAVTQLKNEVEAPHRMARVVDLCLRVLYVDDVKDATESVSTTNCDSSGTQQRIIGSTSKVTHHVFATDLSHKLVCIRVPTTVFTSQQKDTAEVRTPKERGQSFTFRRGSKKIWEPNSIISVSGLEVVGYHEKLGVLDCDFVESAIISSVPSKKSHFFEPYKELREAMSKSAKHKKKVSKLLEYVRSTVLHISADRGDEESLELDLLTQASQLNEEVFVDAIGTASSGLIAQLTISSAIRHIEGNILLIIPVFDQDNMITEAVMYINPTDDSFATITAYISSGVLQQMSAVLFAEDNAKTQADDAIALLQQIIDTIGQSDTPLRFALQDFVDEQSRQSSASWQHSNAVCTRVVKAYPSGAATTTSGTFDEG